MKRLILRIGMMLVTFAFGVGIDRIIAQHKVNNTPPPKIEVENTLSSQSVSLALIEKETALPPVPVATPAPRDRTPKEIILDYDLDEFNPYGYYEIMGSKPKGFSNFGGIELGVSGNDNYPGYVSVYTNQGDIARYDGAFATFVLVTEQRVFFVTSKTEISGVEYRFDGKFLRTDFNSVEGKNTAVLRGTLTKTKNGRKIAEHTFNFRMFGLGC